MRPRQLQTAWQPPLVFPWVAIGQYESMTTLTPELHIGRCKVAINWLQTFHGFDCSGGWDNRPPDFNIRSPVHPVLGCLGPVGQKILINVPFFDHDVFQYSELSYHDSPILVQNWGLRGHGVAKLLRIGCRQCSSSVGYANPVFIPFSSAVLGHLFHLEIQD
jgi:hypothetical protein